MKLELLYLDDCPNWKTAAERLDDIATRRGLVVERRLVTTPEEAEAARFRGSPTILVDGEDPFASEDVVVVIAWRLDRRRHRHDRTGATNDRSAQLEGTSR